MKVNLKSGTIKASVATRPTVRKTYLEKLKDKWEKQKPLKVIEPKKKKNGKT